MKPNECTAYPTCSANLCPLDDDWRKRAHVAGEPVCQVVREHLKDGADVRFATRPVMTRIRPFAIAMLEALREERAANGEMVMGRGAALLQFDAAATTGSVWDKGARLQQSRKDKLEEGEE